MNKQSGFTLVEIAIVLVIIGLLLGGVLKGQELITQAKIKNVANDLNGVTVAIYGYQDRYKRLPGDDPGMTRWTVAGAALTAAQSGDGNNVIGTAGQDYQSTDNTTENRKFWLALRLSGFVAGSTASVAEGSTQPLNAAGGIVGVQSNGLGLAGTIVCTGNLPAKVAQALDSQLDDGNATTGNVRALLETTPPTAVTTAIPGANYADTGTNLYVLCKNI
ncbi:MAG: prepilin-type N-terminal cleavage/methylation domain-containing protein [Rhodocyclaceae bacterium]|nr:prepilin-type N-terminal cleavage/methylation domain-containing protein [Rhodocyclaceae bacterium]